MSGCTSAADHSSFGPSTSGPGPLELGSPSLRRWCVTSSFHVPCTASEPSWCMRWASGLADRAQLLRERRPAGLRSEVELLGGHARDPERPLQARAHPLLLRQRSARALLAVVVEVLPDLAVGAKAVADERLVALATAAQQVGQRGGRAEDLAVEEQLQLRAALVGLGDETAGQLHDADGEPAEDGVVAGGLAALRVVGLRHRQQARQLPELRDEGGRRLEERALLVRVLQPLAIDECPPRPVVGSGDARGRHRSLPRLRRASGGRARRSLRRAR